MAGDGAVGAEVLAQGFLAIGVVEQDKGGEVGQGDALVENQGGLYTAISKEQFALQLGQGAAILGHGIAP
ncbi:hypothetical protein D3C81_2158520 [compost metagenome]